MGFYEDSDNPELYRNNVLEIPVDKLFGVPKNTNGDPTAINSGTVQVRCFIHPYCPFVSTPKEQYDLAFNELTIPVINDVLPEDAKNSLTTTPGIEGMHFKERYVYRHNYIFKERDVNGVTELLQVALPDYDDVNNTRYQEEFSWIVRPSVFDDYLAKQVSTVAIPSLSTGLTFFQQRCTESVSWQYVYPTFTSSSSEIDELHDYKKDFYRNNSRYANTDANKQLDKAIEFGLDAAAFGLKSVPGIDTNRVQVPRQSSSANCLGGGTHWKVEKKTPLYRGEDFFIEFQRYAKATNINTAGDNVSKVRFDKSQEQYAPIDVLGEQWAKEGKYTIPVPTGFNATPKDIYVNNAIRQVDDPKKRTAWRLFDQAYYIIEIGGPDTATQGNRQHYFIIITERAYPIFVSIQEEFGFLYSKTLSAYDENAGGVHGKSIINAETFRVTVRNHLGKLVINFDLNGDRQTPWIVSDTDYKEIRSLRSEFKTPGHGSSYEIPVTIPIVVPNAKISIWGGNLSCGFSFGPLQYEGSALDFRWPQQHGLPMYFNIEPLIGVKTPIRASSVDNEGPTRIPISARLTTSDDYIHDMARYTEVPGTPTNAVSMFTQGAHFYKQWGSSRLVRDFRGWKKGVFFFGQGYDPLIELSAPGYPGVRDSTVELKDFDGMYYDVDRRRSKFWLDVYLEAGSHLFRGKGGGIVPGWRDMVTYQEPTEDNLDDDTWVVESCKTPILTGIRLVAEQDDNPSWPDGTGRGGYSGLPALESEGNDYFRDVSHHVMSYTEDWTAADFYEMEHSGTIKFLLKEINVAKDKTGAIYTYNDTQYLKDLQNKSFYIEIWAGYEPLKDGLEYTQTGGFYKLMTGLCHGGQMEKTAAREIMTCQVKDYKEILKGQKFFNSPFFDGVKDVNAVLEIMNIAGFRSTGQFDPGGYLKMLKEDDYNGTLVYQTGDGRFFTSNPYALPSSYRRIEQAYYKFDAGSTLYDGIVKIAQTASKLFYFDQHGMAHFESYFDLIQQNLLGDTFLNSLFSFTSNPYSPSSLNTTGEIYPGQLIYNKIEWQYRQEDVHTHLKVISSTPNQELLILDDVRWEAIDQPSVEGFIGYKKLFYQKEGMLGSLGAARNLIDFYRVMFRPELYVKFETNGLPIRATDFITVDGQFLRVSKVGHNIDAEKNLWWMNVEGERMQPIQ